MPISRSALWICALALLLLPGLMSMLGLGLTSATEVLIFAIACMALNILVGFTGLVSFGHGAWFGMAAYAAALAQQHWFANSFWLPLVFGLSLIALVSWGFGFLILRRRGVYFSLLTLALCAMLYAVAFRWTAVTGGENGLGGITRPEWLGLDLEQKLSFYGLVAAITMITVYLLWRFHRSPVGSVLLAIRENEQRASFVGYETSRYKLFAFVMSASMTGLAGMLLLFNNRMTSAEPISVVFSGELLAMLVIGGMRSFLGPALGALFYVIFRDLLSSVTEDWLLYFGLLFVFFVLFSPTGLVGIYERISSLWRKKPILDAAMSNRKAGDIALPAFLVPQARHEATILDVKAIKRYFGGIKAVDGVSITVRAIGLHALIGPNGAGKTSAFNLISGLYPLDNGEVMLGDRRITNMPPAQRTQAGIGRSFQITNLFPGLSVRENIRLALQSRSEFRMNPWVCAGDLQTVNDETEALTLAMGLQGIDSAEAGTLSYGGQRLLDMAVALGTKPQLLLLDEPLAGLAAAERERVGILIHAISKQLPVLLIEHDIDRVFSIADAVTVMHEGKVLVDGTVEDARNSPDVQSIYIGSGSQSIASKSRTSARGDELVMRCQSLNTFYEKSHILRDVDFEIREGEILALLGRNGAGKSTLLKTLIGITPPASGLIELDGQRIEAQSAAAIARLGVAYVPQGRGLFSGMSVAQNMELGRLKRRSGLGIHWDEKKIFQFFPRIRERWQSPADYLSGGEQQMVAVARALSGDTRLLLLDEPFEGLAPAIVEELFEALDRLRKEVSIIIVDHHLDLALALSDTTVVLETGSTTHKGPSKELFLDLDLRKEKLWL
jgi:ABC-type branched-subunit amino acid transport system ATPase component/ABC-type branched-subunit amino acid transport system permease subunit